MVINLTYNATMETIKMGMDALETVEFSQDIRAQEDLQIMQITATHINPVRSSLR